MSRKSGRAACHRCWTALVLLSFAGGQTFAKNPPCESMYAAVIAERFGIPCDQPLSGLTGEETSQTWCLDGQTPNECALDVYLSRSNPPPASLARRPYKPRYLSPCANGTRPAYDNHDSDLSTPDILRCDMGDGAPAIRCTDGTRPTVFVATNPESDKWLLYLSGRGEPCGNIEADASDEQVGYSCWKRYYYHEMSPKPDYRRSLTTKFAGSSEPEKQFAARGMLGSDSENLQQSWNRVVIERCASWSGDATLFMDPSTFAGDNSFGGFEWGSAPGRYANQSGCPFDYVGETEYPGMTPVFQHGLRISEQLIRELSSAAGAPPPQEVTQVVLVGFSDTTFSLTLAADYLADVVGTIWPYAETRIIHDSMVIPMVEGEARNLGTVSLPRPTIFDHQWRNPWSKAIPGNGAAYSARDAYGPGGYDRVRLESYGWLGPDTTGAAGDASCRQVHAADDSACHDIQHIFFNHVNVPRLIIADAFDNEMLPVASRYTGYGWTSSDHPDAAVWAPRDFAQRVADVLFDAAGFDYGTPTCSSASADDSTERPVIFATADGTHGRVEKRSSLTQEMHLCDGTSSTADRTLTQLVEAWVGGPLPSGDETLMHGWVHPGGGTWRQGGCTP